MVVKESQANKKIVGSMKIQEYTINPDFSASLVEIDGNHEKIKSIEDRIYFILEGEGKFIIEGEETAVSREDLVFIPKDTPYNMNGKMKYLLIHTPEFKPDNDIKVD